MGTHYLILFGSMLEIVITLLGFRWMRDMLKALAIGIDARFANVDRELQRMTRGGQNA